MCYFHFWDQILPFYKFFYNLYIYHELTQSLGVQVISLRSVTFFPSNSKNVYLQFGKAICVKFWRICDLHLENCV